MGPARAPEPCCKGSVTGRGGEATIRHLPGPTLRPELSARGAETQRRIKGSGVSSVSPKHCPIFLRNGNGVEDDMSRRGHSLARQLGPPVLPTKFPSPRLAMGTERREGVAGARELLAAGDQRRPWPRSPKPGERGARRARRPASEASAAWRACGRAEGRLRRGRKRAARGRCSGPGRPLPGPPGTGITWGAWLCRPRWLSAAPELIKRLFWRREASRPAGVGAACGHGNNQPHSCASTKPAAQREVNSGRLNGSFKRRHLQARPVVN